MFSRTVPALHSRIKRILSESSVPTEAAVREILSKADSGGGLLPEETFALIQTTGDPALRSLVLQAAKGARERFHERKLYLVVPVYVSNFCINACLYCGYRAQNHKILRTLLTEEEFAHEVDWLIEKGYRTIELVLAEDPRYKAPVLANYLALARKKLNEAGGGRLGLNAAPFSTPHDYWLLKEAGLDFLLLWQETYHPSSYEGLHPGCAPKSSYGARLDTPDRALEGGLRSLGMGFLFGLYDWRYELLFLLAHAGWLKEKFGVAPAVWGIPRFKPAPGAMLQNALWPVSDEEYELAVAILGLAFPMTRPFLSTREPWEMTLRLAEGGGCLITLDCSTFPGGYTMGSDPIKKGSDPIRSQGQFQTFSFPLNVYGPEVIKRGYKLYSRWDWN